MQFLYAKGAPFTALSAGDLATTPMHEAARGSRESCIAWLMQRGISPDMRGNRCSVPSHYAAAHGHESLVKLDFSYLAKQSDLDSNNALLYAGPKGRAAQLRCDVSVELEEKVSQQLRIFAGKIFGGVFLVYGNHK
jgi:ankyrin repeat protein